MLIVCARHTIVDCVRQAHHLCCGKFLYNIAYLAYSKRLNHSSFPDGTRGSLYPREREREREHIDTYISETTHAIFYIIRNIYQQYPIITGTYVLSRLEPETSHHPPNPLAKPWSLPFPLVLSNISFRTRGLWTN